jgi:signal transduction histidine kinase
MHRRSGFTDLNLAATLEHVREIYAPLAEDKHILFMLDAVPDAPAVHGDPHLLLEAISNIVDNAIKFTPAGGSVQVRMTAAAEGPRIDVIDSGPGIRVADRGAVLQRCYRGTCSSKDVSGSGLGLSIVAAIVKLHGFRLQIADNPSGGAALSMLCWRDVGRSV